MSKDRPSKQLASGSNLAKALACGTLSGFITKRYFLDIVLKGLKVEAHHSAVFVPQLVVQVFPSSLSSQEIVPVFAVPAPQSCLLQHVFMTWSFRAPSLSLLLKPMILFTVIQGK